MVKRLADLEKRFYERIPYPDLLIVLRVPADVAVSRRSDERESFLRPRSEEVWQRDWSQTPAIVIDTDRPVAEVRLDIRSAVWTGLSSSGHRAAASTEEAAP
jgi:thymidylate kinase